MADSDKPTQSDEAPSPAQEIVSKLSPMLRPDKKGEAERVIGMVLTKTYRGPLPAPEDLAHYEQICPGAADRIINMAEANMSHRHSMEKTLLKSDYGLRSRGQWFALVALFAMLSVIAFTFWLGQPIAGSILGGATLATVTGMFLARDKEVPEEKQPPASTKQQQGKGRKK